jgi:Holliday junction resolvasome RuvABC endonuclease subunit
VNDAPSILGIDLALNHAGLVVLDALGGIDRYLCVTDIVGSAKKDPARTMLLKKHKAVDRQAVQMARLQWWDSFLNTIIKSWKPTHVVVEDYALRAESNAAYNIGEQGAVARLAAVKRGCSLRLHDPMTVKMYGSGNGTATGRELADIASERWDLDFTSFNPEPPKGDKKPNTVPEEDMCAAYVLARMGWTEIQLRGGSTFGTLGLDAKQIQAFNRVTKGNPVNLLGRDWLTNQSTTELGK